MSQSEFLVKTLVSKEVIDKIYGYAPSLSQTLYEWRELVEKGEAELWFDEYYERYSILALTHICQGMMCSITEDEVNELRSWSDEMIAEHFRRYLA